MEANFLEECVAVLSRTPATLDTMLRGLPDAWTRVTEGEGTWSPYDVLGHLNHGEKSDWIPRVNCILEFGETRAFEAFDREAQFRTDQQRPLEELLDEFVKLRRESLAQLRGLNLRADQLELKGKHPTLGEVTLRQLLATWTAHDLAHTLQISRTMAKRYKQEVGPWAAFLSVMK